MTTFIDPRTGPVPQSPSPPARTTTHDRDLADLYRLCREGRVYDIERWIAAGRPLQVADDAPSIRRRSPSPLEVALQREDQSMVLLLLCNGYDVNQERYSPLGLALRARRRDLVDLLLAWGADPGLVNLENLFETYSTPIFEQFRDLGVNFADDHALAEALAHHTSNKPLWGFARRHRTTDANIQRELNIALVYHAGHGNEKGVKLALWAGADPHAPAPRLDIRVRGEDDEGADDRVRGFSAIHNACGHGDAHIVEVLGPDPGRDDFNALYATAGSGGVIELLARYALPHDIERVIDHRFVFLSLARDGENPIGSLRRIFEVGGRWNERTTEGLAAIRHRLLRTPSGMFIDAMRLLATRDYCSPDVLKELARTPSFRTRMKNVGLWGPSSKAQIPFAFPRIRREELRAMLIKFGIETPKPEPPMRPLPRCVTIGRPQPGGLEIRLDRAELLERVWEKPVAKVAEDWGWSGPGLAKACRRIHVPVPPRGFWDGYEALEGPPPLPELPVGEAEEIILRVRADRDFSKGCNSDDPGCRRAEGMSRSEAEAKGA